MLASIKKFFGTVEWRNIKPEVYARWILGIIAIINLILTKLNVNPIAISDSDVYSIASMIFAMVMIIVNTYKNNSTSKESQIADMVMVALKSIEKQDDKAAAIEQITNVLNDVKESTETPDTE